METRSQYRKRIAAESATSDSTLKTPSIDVKHAKNGEQAAAANISVIPEWTDMNKHDGLYYFFPAWSRSFTVGQFRDILTSLYTNNEHNIAESLAKMSPCLLKSELGPPLEDYAFFFEYTTFSCVCSYFKMFVDRSRTNEDTECMISMEPYDDPYIFSADNRSYSYSSLMNMIKTTLLRGEPLRLPTTILYPYQLPKICAYPNFSVGSQATWRRTGNIVFTESDIPVSAAFDKGALYKDVNISSVFDSQYTCNVSGLVCYDIALDTYRNKYSEVFLPTLDKVIENVMLKDIVFPRGHCKDYLVVRNVLLSNVIMVSSCFCGIRFISCRFDNVIIVHTGMTLKTIHPTFSGCAFHGCRFILQKASASTAGKYSHSTRAFHRCTISNSTGSVRNINFNINECNESFESLTQKLAKPLA